MSSQSEQPKTERFSDAKLQTMHTEFYALREDFQNHRKEQQEFNNQLLLALNANTQALADLATRAEGILSAWEASQGALKVMRWVGGTIKWLAGVAVAAGAVWLFLRGK